MTHVALQHLQPGMRLASAVQSRQGRILLHAGDVLTHRHLRTLRAWGVTGAHISGMTNEDVRQASVGNFPDEMVAQAEAVADMRFGAQPENAAFTASCKPWYMEQLLKRMTAGEALPGMANHAAALPRRQGARDPLHPEEIASQAGGLASLPPVYLQILKAINDPRSSAQHVAQAISCDVGLSAKLLALVNSPYFGLSQKVETMDRAVVVIGSRQLSELALGVSLVTAFQNIPVSLFDMQAFWEHSLACAIIARMVASQCNIRREDRYFVAGLLHDVGRLVMLKQFPARCLEAIAVARSRQVPLSEVEEDIWGFDHASLGGVMLRHWGLPDSLQLAVAWHHDPATLDTEGQQVDVGEGARMLHAADSMAHLLHGTTRPAEHIRVGWVLPVVQEPAWDGLGLDSGAAATVLQDASDQLGHIVSLFLPAPSTASAASHVA